MLSEKSFHYFETAATKREMNSDYFEAEWTQYVFTGVLSCNICEESVVFSGDGGVEQDYEHDEQHSGSHFYRFFTPRYFYPPVPIIRIPASEKIPDDVTSLLTKSFELFWCDPDACANRIRATLEVLLDDMQIIRKKKPSATKELSLHDRIELINAPELDDVKQMMLAVKWLGNAGTHELEGIHRTQVLNGYELLEFCLDQLYPTFVDKAPRLRILANAINLAKRPVLKGELRPAQK